MSHLAYVALVPLASFACSGVSIFSLVLTTARALQVWLAV